MNKLATLIGLILGILVIVSSMFDYSAMHFITAFFDLQSAVIVIGGVVAATLINYPLNQLGCVLSAFAIIFSREATNEQIMIDNLLDLAIIAQRKGKLALETTIEKTEQHFLKIALTELMTAHDSESLRKNLENELHNMHVRHANCQEIFYNMASYAPAFGMMGTVMGLIMMMSAQSVDPNPVANYAAAQGQDMMQKLLSGMGLALVTTFYGVLLANFIFLPIAGKLKNLSHSEQKNAEIIIVAMLSIQRQDSPLRTKDELLTFVSQSIRKDIDRQRRK